MNVVLWCLFIAAFLPFTFAIIGTILRGKQLGEIDNNNPRLQQRELTGAAARALAAQQNAWEALAVFTASVVSAYVGQADPGTASTLALVFVAFRVLHGFFYLADQHGDADVIEV